MRKGKDPDPYLWLTNPDADLRGPKTYGSYGPGSGTLPESFFYLCCNIAKRIASSLRLDTVVPKNIYCKYFGGGAIRREGRGRVMVCVRCYSDVFYLRKIQFSEHILFEIVQWVHTTCFEKRWEIVGTYNSEYSTVQQPLYTSKHMHFPATDVIKGTVRSDWI